MDQQTTNYGCLLRLFWMMVGNIALFLCGIAIYQNPTGYLSIADALYWALAGCLVAARFADVQYYEGTTAEGNPATLADWRRYALLVVIVAVIGWLVIHAARYLFLTP